MWGHNDLNSVLGYMRFKNRRKEPCRIILYIRAAAATPRLDEVIIRFETLHPKPCKTLNPAQPKTP